MTIRYSDISFLWDDLRWFSRSSIRDEREHRRLKRRKTTVRRSSHEKAGIDTFGPQSLSMTRVTKARNTKAAGIGIGGSNNAKCCFCRSTPPSRKIHTKRDEERRGVNKIK